MTHASETTVCVLPTNEYAKISDHMTQLHCVTLFCIKLQRSLNTGMYMDLGDLITNKTPDVSKLQINTCRPRLTNQTLVLGPGGTITRPSTTDSTSMLSAETTTEQPISHQPQIPESPRLVYRSSSPKPGLHCRCGEQNCCTKTNY